MKGHDTKEVRYIKFVISIAIVVANIIIKVVVGETVSLKLKLMITDFQLCAWTAASYTLGYIQDIRAENTVIMVLLICHRIELVEDIYHPITTGPPEVSYKFAMLITLQAVYYTN